MGQLEQTSNKDKYKKGSQFNYSMHNFARITVYNKYNN